MAAGAAARPVADPGDWETVDPGDWETVTPKSANPPPGKEPEGFWHSLYSATPLPGIVNAVTGPSQSERLASGEKPTPAVDPWTAAAGAVTDYAKRAYQHIGDAGGKLQQGDIAGAGREYVKAIPFIGENSAKVGQQASEGDWAGAAGTAAGTIGTAAIPELSRQGPVIGTALKGAAKGAVEMTGRRYGIPLPASMAGAAGGGFAGKMIGEAVGMPEIGAKVGTVIGAGAPMVRGAYRELAARKAAMRPPTPAPPGDIPYTPSEPPPTPPGYTPQPEPPPAPSTPPPASPMPSGPVKGQGTPTPEAAEHVANRVSLAKDAAEQLHSQGITSDNLANHMENDEVWDKIAQATDIARKTPLGERRVDLTNPLTRAETIKRLKVMEISDELNRSMNEQ